MQFKNYIQGNRHGKEANQLEREAMNDPFLQGALDGFDSVVGDHAKIIEQLEDKYTRFAVAPKSISKNKSLLYWTVAASVLLLIGVGVYFALEANKVEPAVVTYQSSQIIPADSSALESDSVAESQAEPLIAENKVPKVVPAQTISAVDTNINNSSENYVAAMDTEQSAAAEITDNKQDIQTVQEKSADESVAQSVTDRVAVTDSQAMVTVPDTQKKSDATDSSYRISEGKSDESAQNKFGEKEFQSWCQQRAAKIVCDGKGASVKVSFFINEVGKPSNIEYKKYSCEDAKNEIESLLSSSPVWGKTNRKVTMTIKW